MSVITTRLIRNHCCKVLHNSLKGFPYGQRRKRNTSKNLCLHVWIMGKLPQGVLKNIERGCLMLLQKVLIGNISDRKTLCTVLVEGQLNQQQCIFYLKKGYLKGFRGSKSFCKGFYMNKKNWT